MEVNGTTYNNRTPREVINVLERFRQAWEAYHAGRQSELPNRIRVHYGDAETGADWGDVYSVSGYIGRSTGPMKIPLMIANEQSTGGPGLLEACIVRIRYANRAAGGDIYRHPSYTPPPKSDHPADWAKHFA